jgi:hypothetical protein
MNTNSDQSRYFGIGSSLEMIPLVVRGVMSPAARLRSSEHERYPSTLVCFNKGLLFPKLRMSQTPMALSLDEASLYKTFLYNLLVRGCRVLRGY